MPNLPAWAEMSDLDRGAALMHVHKRDVEGVSYAAQHYPCRYLDSPALVALSPWDASLHAADVGAAAFDGWGDEESRLYDLAVAEDERRYKTAQASKEN
jgi:hypothetical protein